ncbi:MAG TPA: shikimate kinase [Sedimentisphaerales bacterium]|nr:shikimate kinase [Sedimentisphaerales bacterium]HRV49399.1 shikimate kinase [Sedimentisphaerales bacterium]
MLPAGRPITLSANMENQDRNIVLIGMPGVGKSTIGVLLAKALGCHFLDTDVFMQAMQGRSLQEMIDRDGLAAFCQAEEDYVLCLDVMNTVIATGGSVVYSEHAMRHLAEHGVIVHLDLPVERIEERIRNLQTRGVVMEKGQTIRSLYAERDPLYRRYARITIDGTDKNHDRIVTEILEALSL